AVRPRSNFASDVDGDGDLDLLSASVINDRIAWYRNDGAQSFVEFGIDSTAEFATWVEATDLDRDGDMDVLAAASSPSQVVWYENDGNEAFTKRFIGGSFGESSAQVVTPTDFDNDGDTDVVAGFYNNGISWFENSGNQTFTRHVVTTTAGLTGLRSVAVADFDGDGDTDVAAATDQTNRLDWYENDGTDLYFTRHILANENIGYRSVHAGDVDSDGDTDLVAASRTIGWFANEQLAIRGTKFEDTNGDGDRDSEEPPLPGVTIYLDLNDNQMLDGGTEPHDTTEANGEYAWTNLIAGDYVVREVVPDGYGQTFPQAAAPRLFANDPNAASPTRIVEVDPVSGATLNSFSVPGTASGVTAGLAFDGQTIYFIDSNTDTLYELNPDTGAILDSMTLSSTPRWDGIAVLDGLVYINDPATRVIVVIDPATDTIVTTINVPQSNAVPFGGLGELPDDSGGQLVAPIGLSSGVVLLDRVTGEANSVFSHAFVSNGDNFGVTSIDGEIYLGFDDPAGTVLVYTPSGTFLRSFEVGFGMTGLGAASSVDAAHRVTAMTGQSLTGLDFGNHRQLGSIAGTKYEDLDGDGRQDAGEGPLQGVTIYLDINDNGAHDNGEPSTLTDSNGDFLFSDVLVGSYVVREVLSDAYVQTAPGTHDAFFYAGAAVTDELITIDAATGQVTRVGPFGADIVGLARTRSGELFALQATNTDSFYSVDTATGAATRIGFTGGDVVFGLAYDDVTDTIYTLRNVGTTRRLATIDRATGTTTIIGTGSGLVSNVSGLAFDSSTNRVIAFDNGEDEFWAFNVTTGVPTLLATASSVVETFGFTQTGTNFVMPGSFTSLSYVDPTTGAFSPYLTLSEGVGIDGLEYVPAGDGSHRVTVLANTIRDQVDFGNQRRTLTVAIEDSSITENGGSTTGTVSRSGDTSDSSAIVVSLAANDATAATVPMTVTIPAGQSSATFTINAVDDAVADGIRVV
ncbi:MAG: VCBS repeat-containing protein, partial [Planctomycetia bacterium]|nr:VCBS repeat-containing protein [Planctomycetia bacterium]